MEIDDKEGLTAVPARPNCSPTCRDRFAIVTSATRPLAVARPGLSGLSVPRHMITAEDVVHGKLLLNRFSKARQHSASPQRTVWCLKIRRSIARRELRVCKQSRLQTTYPAHQRKRPTRLSANLADVKAILRDENVILEVVQSRL